jgi:Neuraminidase (sialidase)
LDFGQEGFIEYGNYADESSTEWHKVVGENDIYASWSNDGGNTWGNPVMIAGK